MRNTHHRGADAVTDRDQLHHLADRARRGVLLPEEGALLADAITALLDRHDALTAGQCTHYLDTHQRCHTEPVTGCPYPGCHPDA